MIQYTPLDKSISTPDDFLFKNRWFYNTLHLNQQQNNQPGG